MAEPAPPNDGVARRTAWLGLLVGLGGVILTFMASRVTGPAFDEERRFNAVKRASALVHAISDFGPSSMVSSSARAIYDELSPFGVAPGLLSAWLNEALGQTGKWDLLLGARTGWLLVTALAPLSVYRIVSSSRGARAGALAACALFAMPRWIHVAAGATESAFVTSLGLLLIASYLASVPKPLDVRRSVGKKRVRSAGVGFALLLGFAVACDLSTLWVLPLIVVHHWGTRPGETFRTMRRGRAPLPSAFLTALLLSPIALAATAPQLWRGGAVGAAEWFLKPLAPTIEPGLFGGSSVVALADVPARYAASWLVATTPVAMLALALVGGGVLVAGSLAVRRRRRQRDGSAIGWLVFLAVVAVAVGPFVVPRVFVRYPPRAEAALPFLAMAAGIGLDRVIERFLLGIRGVVAAAVVACVLVAFGLSGVPGAGASFGLLAGGTRGASKNGIWSVGDGSELARLAPSIDALGSPRVQIETSDVPKGYFALLNQVGRLRTKVDLGRSGHGGLRLVRGDRDRAIDKIVVGGATLWSLVKN